jgi:MFS family permease
MIAAAFMTVMAFSAAPAPLYPLYMRHDHFSTFMVTIVFAVYAVGVMVSLFLAGHASDWAGRKPVLLPAFALEVVSAAIFLIWPELAALLVARFINGIGVGVITATATAHLHELHARHRPGATPTRFEFVSTAANIGGLGVGPLVVGFLAQYVPDPLHVPYAVFLVALLATMAAVAFAPETVDRAVGEPSWRPQRISIHGDLPRYLVAVGGAFSAFAVLGLFTSLAPGFVGGTLHHPSRLLAGLTVFIVFAAAAAGQTLTERLRPALRSATGVVLEAAGLVMVAAGMGATNLTMFLLGGAIAGTGGGVLFKSAVGTVASMSAPSVRGEALAGLFLIGYLGMSVPAVGMGIATEYITATTAMAWFTGILLALLAGLTAILVKSNRERQRTATPNRASRAA